MYVWFNKSEFAYPMNKKLVIRIPLHVQVKIKRIELGMSDQLDLANKAGLSQSFISRFESGKHTNIGIDNFRRICVALDYYDWDLNLSGIQL